MLKVLIGLLLTISTLPFFQSLDTGDVCLQFPYPEPTGLQTGGRGQVLPGNFLLDVTDSAFKGRIIGQLTPQETFVVLEGPSCWRVQPTTNNREEWRGWRIRSEQRNLEGWIADYKWFFFGGVAYRVKPLNDDEPGVIYGDALIEPVTFSGELTWTGIGGPIEPHVETIPYTFEGQGYLEVSVQTDPPELTNPDSICRVVVEVTRADQTPATTIPIQILGDDIIHGSPLDKVWVSYGEYHFRVDLFFVVGAPGTEGFKIEDMTCPEATYTLTLKPAQISHIGANCAYAPYGIAGPFPVYPTPERSPDTSPAAMVDHGSAYPVIARTELSYQIVLREGQTGWVHWGSGGLHGDCDELPFQRLRPVPWEGMCAAYIDQNLTDKNLYATAEGGQVVTTAPVGVWIPVVERSAGSSAVRLQLHDGQTGWLIDAGQDFYYLRIFSDACDP